MGITRTNICETQFIIPQVKSLIHLFDTRHLMPEEDLEKMRLNTPEMQKLDFLAAGEACRTSLMLALKSGSL